MASSLTMSGNSEKEALVEDLPENPEGTAFAPRPDCFWLLPFAVLYTFKEPSVKMVVTVLNCLLAYTVNVVIQVVITALLLLGAARLEMPGQASTFLDTHTLTLKDATRMLESAARTGDNTTLGDEFTSENGILARCEPQLGVRYLSIYTAIITIWLLMILPEFKLVVGELRALTGVAPTGRLQRMMASSPESPLSIVALSWPARALFLLTVPMMRGLIAVLVAYSGAKWFVLQTNMLTMVMKSLCMKFVLGMDDAIFKALASEKVQQDLSITRLVTYQKESCFIDIWRAGLNGLTIFTVSVGVAAVFTQVHYVELMAFRRACWKYLDTFNEVWTVEAALGFDTFFKQLFHHF